MLLSQIEAFVEVARTRTVSGAADTLFITQPALTARLQRLEEELDTRLFVRTPRGMKLTESGEVFLPHAVKALDSLADGRRIVNAFERGGAGRLTGRSSTSWRYQYAAKRPGAVYRRREQASPSRHPGLHNRMLIPVNTRTAPASGRYRSSCWLCIQGRGRSSSAAIARRWSGAWSR